MKIVIFGSTGMTGVCAVEAAVNKGYDVRAFLRDPSKLPGHLKSKVEIFKGDVLNIESVIDAISGTDGVVIALGTNGNLEPSTFMSEGTKNIVSAMHTSSVKRVSACISAFLFYDDDKVPERFHSITKDHKRMYEVLKDSDLDWIAVFPPHIADTPSSDLIIEINPDQSPGRAVSKLDLGKFLVDSLSEPKYYKAVIGICNVPQQ